MKKYFIFFTVAVVIFSTVSACGGWLIYHKPEFRGRVIDADTKTPIEGVVAVVVYYKFRLIGHVGGGHIQPLDARETLTDTKGEFFFPSYTAFTLFSREDSAQFIIYKPAYMYSEGPPELNYPMTEKFFSIDVIGKVGEINAGPYGSWNGILGVVVLKRGDRSATSPPEFRSEKLPLLYKAINEDRNNRGLEGEIK